MRGSQRVLCVHLPAASSAHARALGEACLRSSSQVAVRLGVSGSPAVFVEAGRSGWLYAPAGVARRVQAAARRLALPQPWRLGWGRDAAEAYAQARWGRGGQEASPPENGALLLPLEALQAYASPFLEHEESEQAVAAFVQVFRELGLADLGAFARLPLRTLETRFGPQAALLRERVLGRWDMAWPRFEPEPLLEEVADTRQVETQDGVSAGEALLFYLKNCCDRVSARLGGRGLRAAALELGLAAQQLGRRGEQWRLVRLELPLPQGGSLGLQRVLRERLEAEWRLRPLAGAVVRLSLKVTRTAPGLGAQRHLWEKKEEETEAWAALINRLRQRLGEDQVFLGELVQRYLPEKAWKRVFPQEKLSLQGEGGVQREVPRPTRLLPQALPLLQQGDLLAHAASQRRWHARHWEGPERLSGEWWEDPEGRGFARDYFKVDTEEGEELWVYTVSGPNGASLWWQGVFD